ncbi:MAG: phosphodiester glycosidase family protein [Acidobacteriota bacterium]
MTQRTLVVLSLLLVATVSYGDWRNVAPGVDYQEFTPPGMDLHVTRIDLTNDRIKVIATRESERGLKVSDFAKREKAIVAINGDYFDEKFHPVGLVIGPCGPWEGTKDTKREGVVAIGGKRATIARQSAVMDPPEKWIEAAVSGWPVLVVDCEVVDPLPGSDVFTRAPHPRTAVALDEGGTTMYFVVADGRRSGVAGMTLPQLAQFIVGKLHAWSAINLDGGGSTAMWVDDEIVNRPSDGVERPVGDHLAVVLRSDYVACDLSERATTAGGTARITTTKVIAPTSTSSTPTSGNGITTTTTMTTTMSKTTETTAVIPPASSDNNATTRPPR